MLNSRISIPDFGIRVLKALIPLLWIWPGKIIVCPPVCLILRVLLHMHNCKASGSLIVPLWHSAPFWPMICPDAGRFANFIVDWMELPTFREAFIPGSFNSVFGNENLNFRMLALRIHFNC